MNAAGEPAAAPARDDARRPAALNLPNIISLSRVAITPLLIWLLTDPGRTAAWLAALAFFVA
jgi:phosphatidylglycerophosphate synthase